MAEFEPVAGEDGGDQIQAEILVVGGGIAGMTAAIETAELGKTLFQHPTPVAPLAAAEYDELAGEVALLDDLHGRQLQILGYVQ